MIFSIFMCTLFSLSRTPGQAFLQPEMLLSIIQVNYILQLIFFFCDFKSIPLCVRVSNRFIAARLSFLGRSNYTLFVFISPSFSLSLSLSLSLPLSLSLSPSLALFFVPYLTISLYISHCVSITLSISFSLSPYIVVSGVGFAASTQKSGPFGRVSSAPSGERKTDYEGNEKQADQHS